MSNPELLHSLEVLGENLAWNELLKRVANRQEKIRGALLTVAPSDVGQIARLQGEWSGYELVFGYIRDLVREANKTD